MITVVILIATASAANERYGCGVSSCYLLLSAGDYKQR